MAGTPRTPRYPKLLEPTPSRNPFRGAGRCKGCQGIINISRRGSELDFICNRLVNPHAADDSGTPAEAARTPRRGSYEERLERVQALHLELRQGRPGWGRIDVRALERMV